MGRAVFQDGDLYVLYYVAMNRLCRAESRDGIHWTKPPLGLLEIGGSKANNVIGTADGDQFYDPAVEPAASVCFDTRPDVPADERYKALWPKQRRPCKAWARVSAGGKAFRKLQAEPVLTIGIAGAFDGGWSMFCSEFEGQYVIYLRHHTCEANRRAVARMTSPDFLDWTDPVPTTFGDAGKIPPEHIYINQTRPYFRAPHIYILLAARFMAGRQALTDAQAKAAGARRWDDCSETVLMTARARNHYDMTFREGFVRPGIGALNWGTRSNYAVEGIVPTGESEMSIYVTRHFGQPSWHFQRLVLRTDGLASVNAPFAGGEMLTKLLVFEGNELVINCSTSAAGSIRVEIQDANGEPVEGFSLEEMPEIIGGRDRTGRALEERQRPGKTGQHGGAAAVRDEGCGSIFGAVPVSGWLGGTAGL